MIHNAGTLGPLRYLRNLRDWTPVAGHWDLNVTSLCAVKPFASWSLYCASKAARDMLFRCLAEEETDVSVLNYAPGPVETAMQDTIAAETEDPGVRGAMGELRARGGLLSPAQSAAKL